MPPLDAPRVHVRRVLLGVELAQALAAEGGAAVALHARARNQLRLPPPERVEQQPHARAQGLGRVAVRIHHVAHRAADGAPVLCTRHALRVLGALRVLRVLRTFSFLLDRPSRRGTGLRLERCWHSAGGLRRRMRWRRCGGGLAYAAERGQQAVEGRLVQAQLAHVTPRHLSTRGVLREDSVELLD